ncbi:hypothetical protein C2G38_2246724 [Gigaspora rosea]|uniref:HD domain-containing protein n=1 Tax=Gigaspora rosea TaxID=44941 RepID=A0A397V4Q3_9GLOM|nr:hypothetical protein C2G38_2246724 [Gigaspora rosea]
MFQEEKLINDPIHGYMTFKKWAVEFIDTEEFQRLRDIKQLGASYYVFPGACHNRFEHSLGTAHLAYTLTKKLYEQEGISKQDKDLECVTLAALCHDLGHGPFSHVFDHEVIPELGKVLNHGKIKWKHEDASEMMLDHLYESPKPPSIELGTDDLDFIKALIRGDQKKSDRSPYLFDIVSNSRNSIDVDKFDYLARDCYYLGRKSLFDSSRLMKFAYVKDDQIMYYHKECVNIYEMFHTRYFLHKRIYNHRVTRAINFMIRDALVKANSKYHFEEIIKDPELYIKLNDSILYEIEYSNQTELEDSRKIVKRIRQRKLYKFVNECLIPKNRKGITKENLNECKIANYGKNLKEEDIIVDWQDLNYAKGENNPVEAVKFYKKNYKKKLEVIKLEPDEIRYLFLNSMKKKLFAYMHVIQKRSTQFMRLLKNLQKH